MSLEVELKTEGEDIRLWQFESEPDRFRLSLEGYEQAIMGERELRTLAIALNMAADELKERSDAAR